MSAVVQEWPILSSLFNELDACHVVCCDDNWALCGEDVSEHEWTPDAPRTCPLCDVAPQCWICGATGVRRA